MAVGKNGEFTLQLGIRMKNEEYFELCLRAEKLTVLRSDNEPIDLAQFKKLGEEYWAAFAARKQK